MLVVRGLDYSNAATDLSRSERRYQLVASALAQRPARTVFVASQHSGSLRYYTGRDVLRWDLMDAASIDAALQYLSDRGYHLYWVGDPVERAIATSRFPGTHFRMRLDSTPLQTVADVQVLDLGPVSGG